MFDIDKIFLSMKAYLRKEGKLTDKFEDTSIEHHQNTLLDDYIALLCDTIELKDGTKTTRSMHMLHAAIDNDTSLLEDVIEDLQEAGHKKPLNSYDAYTLRHMCRAKDDFITGKTGIGPYALNNNSQVLTTLYEVEFAEAEGSIMTRLGLNSLHRQFDRDGESIMSWLSGLINIHVDVAKDPKHNKLNINGYTHNLVNLLIRTGFGKTTFYFTTQPIMKELATIINNASGKYMLKKGVSQSKLKKDAEQQFIINIAKANGIQGKTFGRVMHNWEESMHKRQIGINATIDWLLQEGSDVLRQIAKSGDGMNSKKTYEVQTLWAGKPHTEVLSAFDIQMLVYRAFNQFTPYAGALSNLVKYSKIDTKKHGKNLMEQKKYMQGYQAMFNSESQDKSRLLFKTDGLDRLRDKTYIGHMTENAIGVFNEIMGSQIIQGTDKFIGRAGLMDAVLSTIDRFGSTDDQLLRAVSGAILAKKKSTFFNDYARDNDIDIKGLVDGNNTIYNRLCKIKSEIICTEKYKSLLDANGNIRNYLLRTLVAGYTHDFVLPKTAPYGSMLDDYKSVKFVNTLNFIDDESIDQDEFVQAWDDLLNDTRFPELLKFAKDLIVYAFITAGDNGGRHDLMKFVPNSWKIQSGYVDEMVRLLDRFNDKTVSLDSTMSREDIEDVILNNWYDDNFVHIVNINNVLPFYSKVKQPNGSVKSTQFATVIGIPSNTTVTSEYIKIARENVADPESQRRYVLYKRVGYGRHEEQVERMINGEPKMVTDAYSYPIYVAIEPRGNRFTDSHVILSYGRDESTKESLTNMCLDVLAMGILTHSGVKAENTEQIFAMLSKIFHELDPVVRDLSRQKYSSLIQDVVEEYNNYMYAAFEEPAADVIGAQEIVQNYNGNWTREDVANDPKSLYIFTDNTDRDSGKTPIDPNSEYAKKYGVGKHYPTMTQAVVRGLNNAMPISTQRWYHDGAKGETGRWTDDSFDEFKKTIDEEFDAILEEWKTGKYDRIVFGNEDGLFNTKISNITELRTPKIYKYLKDKLSWFKNEVNTLRNRSLSTNTESDTLAELWSKKEGWSLEYFKTNVFTRLHEAWLIEFKLADNQDMTLDKDHTARMDFDYRNNKAPGITATSTLLAIKNGERTATTRYESDGHMYFWQKFKVGDFIRFNKHDRSGKIIDTVVVEVTKPITKLQPETTTIAPTAEEAEKRGENVFEVPEQLNFDAEGLEQNIVQQLTQPEKQVEQPNEDGVILGKLGVDKSNLQNLGKDLMDRCGWKK